MNHVIILDLDQKRSMATRISPTIVDMTTREETIMLWCRIILPIDLRLLIKSVRVPLVRFVNALIIRREKLWLSRLLETIRNSSFRLEKMNLRSYFI